MSEKESFMDYLRPFLEKVNALEEYLKNVAAEEEVWTNPNPTAGVATKFIEMPLADIDEVEIDFALSVSELTTVKTIKVRVGETSYINFFTHIRGTQSEPVYIFTRPVSVSSEGVNINTCYLRLTASSTYSTQQNNSLIPIRVRSIKFNRGGVVQAIKHLFRRWCYE